MSTATFIGSNDLRLTYFDDFAYNVEELAYKLILKVFNRHVLEVKRYCKIFTIMIKCNR